MRNLFLKIDPKLTAFDDCPYLLLVICHYFDVIKMGSIISQWSTITVLVPNNNKSMEHKHGVNAEQ
jgi:hypothetical protein